MLVLALYLAYRCSNRAKQTNNGKLSICSRYISVLNRPDVPCSVLKRPLFREFPLYLGTNHQMLIKVLILALFRCFKPLLHRGTPLYLIPEVPTHANLGLKNGLIYLHWRRYICCPYRDCGTALYGPIIHIPPALYLTLSGTVQSGTLYSTLILAFCWHASTVIF